MQIIFDKKVFWLLGMDFEKAKQTNMVTISVLVGLGKRRNSVKNNRLKIFRDGSLAIILLTVLAIVGMVDGRFHMTNIAQNPQPGEQVRVVDKKTFL